MAEAPERVNLVDQINQKLDRLGRKADELQNLSQRNQDALVDPQGPIMQALSAVRQRVSGLSRGIQRIIDAKATLERLVRDTDTNLGALEQRLNDTIREIDVAPLVAQLQPLTEEVERIEALINTAGLPDVPAGPPGPPPAGPPTGDVPPAGPPTGDDAGDDGNPAVGGYVIPKYKKRTPRSSMRKSHTNSSTKSHKKKGGRRSTKKNKKHKKK